MRRLCLLATVVLTGFFACADGDVGGGGSGGNGGNGAAGSGGGGGSAGSGDAIFSMGPCNTNMDCRGGSLCGPGLTCQANTSGGPCSTSANCLGGESCTNGRCGCGGEIYQAQSVPPNVLIVLDRSDSMNDTISNNLSKWQIAKTAISNLLAT